MDRASNNFAMFKSIICRLSATFIDVCLKFSGKEISLRILFSDFYVVAVCINYTVK